MQSTFDQRVEAKRAEINLRMAQLGRRIEAGNESELLLWVIPQQLACAHRPLRHHPLYGGSRQTLPSEAPREVIEWAELIEVEGIRSILSLMHDGDLRCYGGLDLGGGDLLEFLKRRGFVVDRHPYEDPAHKRSRPDNSRRTLCRVREEALQSYDQLPKPVLLMCSAGPDRSAPVAAYIFSSRVPMS